jgi:hypothetical protein
MSEYQSAMITVTLEDGSKMTIAEDEWPSISSYSASFPGECSIIFIDVRKCPADGRVLVYGIFDTDAGSSYAPNSTYSTGRLLNAGDDIEQAIRGLETGLKEVVARKAAVVVKEAIKGCLSELTS